MPLPPYPLWRVETQLRVPYPVPGGYYYWTQVWLYRNQSSDPFSGPEWNAVINSTRLGTTTQVERVAVRIIDQWTGNVFGIVTIGPTPGVLDPEDGGILIDTVRLIGWSAGKQVAYKRWRIPLRRLDFAGDMLAPRVVTLFNDTIIPILAPCRFCGWSTSLVDSWSIDPRPRPWQLRHGSKRRVGPVFAYP